MERTTQPEPQEHHIGTDQVATEFRHDVPAAARITSGDTVVVETLDCFWNRLDSPEVTFTSTDDLQRRLGALNPVTGPIVVEGAEVGDVLEIRIDSIEVGTVAPYAVTVLTDENQGYGQRDAIALSAETRIAPIVGDRVQLETARGTIELPIRPMVGSIGVAAEEPMPSLHFGPRHGGNVDSPDLSPGATIRLPVRVPGGYLWIGDVHAAMGDAEITGTALETSGRVRVKVTLRRGLPASLEGAFQLDDEQTIGAVGALFRSPLTDNVMISFAELHRRLTDDYGFTDNDAHILLGAAATVTVNQCVDDIWTAARAAIDRSLLPNNTVPSATARA